MASSQIPAYLKSIGAGGLGGAAAGSAFGPIGTGVGALGGGLLGALTQYLQGNGEQGNPVPTVGGQGNPITGYNAASQQFPRFNEEQLGGLSQLLKQGLGNTDFNAIENLARSNFQSKTIPSLVDRFNGLGGKSKLSSPDFQRDYLGASNDLETRLAALRSGHGFNQLQLGLQPTFENIYTPMQQGLVHQGANIAGQSLPLLLTVLLQNILSNRGGQ